MLLITVLFDLCLIFLKFNVFNLSQLNHFQKQNSHTTCGLTSSDVIYASITKCGTSTFLNFSQLSSQKNHQNHPNHFFFGGKNSPKKNGPIFIQFSEKGGTCCTRCCDRLPQKQVGFLGRSWLHDCGFTSCSWAGRRSCCQICWR